jgi:hypothetical protein
MSEQFRQTALRDSSETPLDSVIICDYTSRLTANELKRKLAKLGCTFEQGTNHTKCSTEASSPSSPAILLSRLRRER